MGNPLDDIVDELVVFRHEDGTFVSNSMYWNDSRIREAWINKYGEDAPIDDNEDGEPDEEEIEDYNTWTNDNLRAELSNRGLSVDGKKVDLIARLEENDSE